MINTDITFGIQVCIPNVFVQWNTDIARLKAIFSDCTLNCVTPEYYCVPVLLPVNIDCMLGFHLNSNTLSRMELFRSQAYNESHDLRYSYNDFQSKFETLWGKPHQSVCGIIEGLDSHFWHFGNIEITHSVYERFVLCEGVSIKRLS